MWSMLIATRQKKRMYLPNTMKIPQLDQSKCILLDQPGWQLVSEEDWSTIQSSTSDFLKSLGVDLYYKKHPSGRKGDEEYYLKKGFKIIKDNRSAEEVIVERKVWNYRFIYEFCFV